MNLADFFVIFTILMGAIYGFKRGAIKGAVKLIGLVSIVIISYAYKGVIANFLIKYLPFFNFGGKLDGLYSLNFIVYNVLSFIVIFILLYCVLNIIIEISGFIDKLVKLTIIFELPNKIIGAIIGVIESLIFLFMVSFIMLNFSFSQKYIMESKFAKGIVERTPVVSKLFGNSIVACEKIYAAIEEYQTTKDATSANLAIIRTLIGYELVTSDEVNECIKNGKLHLDNVVVAS